MRKKTAQAEPRDWRWKEILARLDAQGLSLTALAERHGVRVATLQAAKRRVYPAAERRIAEAIGVGPASIWPSRYHADGRHRRKGEDRARQKPLLAGQKHTHGLGRPVKVNITQEETA